MHQLLVERLKGMNHHHHPREEKEEEEMGGKGWKEETIGFSPEPLLGQKMVEKSRTLRRRKIFQRLPLFFFFSVHALADDEFKQRRKTTEQQPNNGF